MKPYSLLILLLLAFNFCVGQVVKNNSTYTCVKELGLKRRITKLGNVIDYKSISANEYKLQWGTKGGHLRTFHDTLSCDDPSVRNPWLVEESKNYLLMKYECGSSCWAGIVLPLYKGSKARTIYFYVATDLKNDLIASIDVEENVAYPVIIIHNLRSGKTQTVTVKEGCIAASPHYCLDSISIHKKILYYKWSANLEGEPRTKKIKIRV